ncbi:hypothetical protein [Haladaptatus sp. NG-WS-4]
MAKFAGLRKDSINITISLLLYFPILIRKEELIVNDINKLRQSFRQFKSRFVIVGRIVLDSLRIWTLKKNKRDIRNLMKFVFIYPLAWLLGVVIVLSIPLVLGFQSPNEVLAAAQSNIFLRIYVVVSSITLLITYFGYFIFLIAFTGIFPLAAFEGVHKSMKLPKIDNKRKIIRYGLKFNLLLYIMILFSGPISSIMAEGLLILVSTLMEISEITIFGIESYIRFVLVLYLYNIFVIFIALDVPLRKILAFKRTIPLLKSVDFIILFIQWNLLIYLMIFVTVLPVAIAEKVNISPLFQVFASILFYILLLILIFSYFFIFPISMSYSLGNIYNLIYPNGIINRHPENTLQAPLSAFKNPSLNTSVYDMEDNHERK